MSFHLDMLHRSLPAWEYAPSPTRADWITFAVVLTLIVSLSTLAVIGWVRWLA